MRRNKNIKKFNKKPPFYWPLILMLLIIIEVVVLTKERTWSQIYGVNMMKLRDQVEKISNENELIISSIYKIYSSVPLDIENNSSTLLAFPERKILTNKNETAILGALNEKVNRY